MLEQADGDTLNQMVEGGIAAKGGPLYSISLSMAISGRSAGGIG